MTWLTWRQHRQQALFMLLGLAALAALLVPTGRQMHGALAASGLSDCLKTLGPADRGCGDLVSAFSHRFRELSAVAVLLLVVPLLIGMFLGPPLVARELERGTHRLVWTQGVSRLRWALVKIGLVAGFAVTVAGVFAVLLEWWIDWIVSSAHYDANGHRLSEGAQSFCARGDATCVGKFDVGPLRGAYNAIVYQPAGRFWTFQAIETGIYVALAAVLLAVAVHRIRRRVS